MSRFAVFKRPPLRRLFLAGLPADLADWLDYIAIITILTYVWNEGPWILALFAIAYGTPYILVGPFVGAVIDRMDLRQALIITNLGRALTTFAMFFAPGSAILLGLMFLRGAIESGFTPARQSAIQALARDDEREAVNGMVHSANQLTKIIGPALGGLLMTLMVPQMIFLLNGCLSLLALAGFALLDLPKRAIENQKDESLFASAAEGFRLIGANPLLRLGTIFITLNLFAIFLYDTFFALITKALGYPSDIYGYAIAAVGVGGVVGGVLVSGMRFGNRHLPIMAVAAAIAGSGTLGLGLIHANTLVPPVWAFVGFFGLFGVVSAFVQVPYRTLVQNESPPDAIGRVVATGEALSIVAMLLAPLTGAFLAEHFGIAMPFIVGGTIVLLAALLGFLPAESNRSKNS